MMVTTSSVCSFSISTMYSPFTTPTLTNQNWQKCITRKAKMSAPVQAMSLEVVWVLERWGWW